MSTTLPTTTTQALEALKARAFADPTPAEIAAMQQQMDAEMRAAHPAWAQRTSPAEAERAIRIERSAQYREARDADAVAMLKARDEKAKMADPTPVVANWTQKYETVRNADQSISYVRDGEERIRDNGDGISVIGGDRDSIRDSIRLAREKWGNEIAINVKDENKRDELLRECARQGVAVQPELRERYAELKAEIEKQRAEAELAKPEPEKDCAAEREAEVEHEM